ncbi:hypothetical protein D8S78_22525 [Natrialba swarupiae]|nr:hypothetical protein [Natrialba swarupiae]
MTTTTISFDGVFVDEDRDGDWSRVSSRAVDPVGGSSSTTETFTYSTSEGDGPDVDVGLTVFDGDISDDPEWHNRVDHRTVPVVSEDAYKQEATVNLTSWNAPEEGDDLELTADIEHDDLPDGSHTVPVVFYANGETIEERSVALSGPGSDSVSESFTYETTQGDAPDVTAGVRTPGDRQSESVRVFGSGFQVEILETNAPVNESERMQATVAIQNIGDIADAQDVRLIVDRAGDDPDNRLERRQDNASINLGVGETTTEQFSYRTGSNEPPVVDLIARSENDEDRVTATVRPDAPRFEVTEIELPESAEAGEEVPITAEITNEGAAGERSTSKSSRPTNSSTSIDPPFPGGEHDGDVHRYGTGGRGDGRVLGIDREPYGDGVTLDHWQYPGANRGVGRP